MNTFITQIHFRIIKSQLLLVILAWALLAPAVSEAFFTNIESSPGQVFRATELVTLPVSSATTTVSAAQVGIFGATFALSADSTAARYDVEVVHAAGPLCDSLLLRATTTETTQSDQAAAAFASIPHEVAGNWGFGVTVSPGVVGLIDGSQCQLELEMAAWQANMTKENAGYRDNTTFTVTVIYNESTAPDPNPGPTTPVVQTGDVVINEVMWMGSSAGANDEWIELRNTTSAPIAISGWQLTNTGSANATLTLPASTSIPAGGLYLVMNYDPVSSDSAIVSALSSAQVHIDTSLSLANTYSTNGALSLQTDAGVIIDETPTASSSAWPAGHNQTSPVEERWSMQRGAIPGDGSNAANWYTCTPSVLQTDGTYAQMQGYWKSGADSNCGTPGYANLSSNDPTKPGYADWLATQMTITAIDEPDEALVSSEQTTDDAQATDDMSNSTNSDHIAPSAANDGATVGVDELDDQQVGSVVGDTSTKNDEEKSEEHGDDEAMKSDDTEQVTEDEATQPEPSRDSESDASDVTVDEPKKPQDQDAESNTSIEETANAMDN